MSDRYFVDTNVLVYYRDAGEPLKQSQARRWLETLWRDHSGRLSYQVLSEFYVTVTAKLEPGMPPDQAQADVRALLAWDPGIINERILEAAWAAQQRYNLSWWDSLIVASGQSQGCRYLLTEDMQDGMELGSIKVVNPFV